MLSKDVTTEPYLFLEVLSKDTIHLGHASLVDDDVPEVMKTQNKPQA